MDEWDSDEIFRAALRIVSKTIPTGDMAEVCKKIEVSHSHVSQVISDGSKKGMGDPKRRKLAFALGYRDYESFLDIGRRELGLATIAEQRYQESLPVPIGQYLDNIQLVKPSKK